MKVIQVDDLPDELVQALERIAQTFRERCGPQDVEVKEKPQAPRQLPVWPGTGVGTLTRSDIYER
jgi:hypothetical protein